MPDLVLVADSSEARIYRLLRPKTDGAPLQQRARLVRATARLPKRALVTSETGRVFPTARRGGSKAGGMRSGADSDKDPHTVEILRFARRIAKAVDAERQAVRAQAVVVIAETQMLGVLRKELTAATRRVIRREVAKDMTHGTDREIHALAIARD